MSWTGSRAAGGAGATRGGFAFVAAFKAGAGAGSDTDGIYWSNGTSWVALAGSGGGGLYGGIIDGGDATTTYAGVPAFDFGSAT